MTTITLPFPISIRGSVPLPLNESTAVEHACDNLVTALEAQGAHVDLYRLPDIRLSVPLFRGWRWTSDLVATLDRVDLSVGHSEKGPILSYRLSLLRLTAIGSLMLVAMILAVARGEFGQFPVWLYPVMWLWIVGGNYFFTLARANRFIRKAVAGSPKGEPIQSRVGQSSAQDGVSKRTGWPPINWP